MYEHLEGDIIRQPGKYGYLYAHHHHTRLAPYGGENQFAVLNILSQCLWNKLMDAQWRWIWKRKNPWYDAWKDAEFQIFRLRAQYEPRFPNAPHLITDGQELLDKESNKCKKEEMMEYLLHLSREPLYLLHWVWPLPIGLGGQYT